MVFMKVLFRVPLKGSASVEGVQGLGFWVHGLVKLRA